MSRGLLAIVAALLAFLSDRPVVQGCSCGSTHPQQDYCHSDVVVKGKVVSMEVIGGDSPRWIQYKIQQQEMFKGLEKMDQVQYVYTPYTDYLCGFVLQPEKMNEDYLLSGNIDSDGKVYINLCGFNKPWAELTVAQRIGLNGTYAENCQCTIVACRSLPCSVTADNQCLWTEGIFTRDLAGTQTKRYTCSPQASGLCRWVPLKARAIRHSKWRATQ